jgi:hypothetical protein
MAAKGRNRPDPDGTWVAQKYGHAGETNWCGHHVRQLASLQVRHRGMTPKLRTYTPPSQAALVVVALAVDASDASGEETPRRHVGVAGHPEVASGFQIHCSATFPRRSSAFAALAGWVHMMRWVNRSTFSRPAVNSSTAAVAMSAAVVGWGEE